MTASPSSRLPASIDFIGLANKTRRQIDDVFPGRDLTFNGWHEFDDLILWFNEDKDLCGIHFTFPEPVSEAVALELVQARLGLPLGRTRAKRAPSCVRFEGVHPAVEVVSLVKDFPRDLISSLVLIYEPGWFGSDPQPVPTRPPGYVPILTPFLGMAHAAWMIASGAVAIAINHLFRRQHKR